MSKRKNFILTEKIKINYSQSKFFEEVFELIRKQLNHKEEYLCNLNENFLKLISLKSKIKCEFIKASELNVIGSKSDLILNNVISINQEDFKSRTI